MRNTNFLPKIFNRAPIRSIQNNLKVKGRICLSCRQQAVILKDKKSQNPVLSHFPQHLQEVNMHKIFS